MESCNRDFNLAAKIILAISLIIILREITSCITAYSSYALFGGDNCWLIIVMIIINCLILVSGILTFARKSYGLIFLTFLYIIRLFVFNWGTDVSISEQFIRNLIFFIRDFGIFAIAMCFKKNGVSGWYSMLSSKHTLKTQEFKEVENTEEDIVSSTKATSNLVAESSATIEAPFVDDLKKNNKNENLEPGDNSGAECNTESKKISLCNNLQNLSKKKKVVFSCMLAALLGIAFFVIFVNFNSYPNYVTSFNDKWKYTLNLPNNELGRRLFCEAYSSRKNTLYLFEAPGYNKEICDSARFFKNRDDLFREIPSITAYYADSEIDNFERISKNEYYIVKPKSGDPYYCLGSQLISNDDNVASMSKIVYNTKEYNYKKQLEEEIKIIDEAAQLPLSDINLINEIGKFYEKAGVLSKAIDFYRFELEHNGTKSPVRGMLAYALALNGESSDARKEAEKSIEMNPKDTVALSAMAILEAEDLNWKEVKSYAKRAIDYGAQDSYVYYVYCEALYKQGEIKAAQKYYNMAYELYSKNPWREKYKDYAGCPFEVLSFHYGSFKDGNCIIPYDEPLVKNKCYYIGFRIDVNVLRRENVEIGIKLYSNGRLELGNGSKNGFTFTDHLDRSKLGKNSYYLSGWGSEGPGAWTPGEHQIEIWYKDKKIAEDSFYIY
ncbi:tetratricopeptide repeat protein [Xylanibacter ruminicola]|uniref:tetratricopeptide repeat protein n=1 Tax=Xylanibacter ruminicola TaxID=839 RepID=UPI000491DEB9|nr:hypothetical protein [Xylanibacter ruminicola]